MSLSVGLRFWKEREVLSLKGKSIAQRIHRIEKFSTRSTDPRWKVVHIDKTGPMALYTGDCGVNVDESAYVAWLRTLTFDDQLVVITESMVPCTDAEAKAKGILQGLIEVDHYAAHTLVEFKNNAGQNVRDLLKAYQDELENTAGV